LAVKAVVVATPALLVVVEFVIVVLANVLLAPLAGAVNVIRVPPTSTGFPKASSTVALKGVMKTAPSVALWFAPPVCASCVGVLATIVYPGLLTTRVRSAEVWTVMVSVPAAVELVAVVPTPATTVTATEAGTAIFVVTVTLLRAD
jgi:hypothetical protein